MHLFETKKTDSMFKFNFNPDNEDDTKVDEHQDAADLLPSKEVFPTGKASFYFSETRPPPLWPPLLCPSSPRIELSAPLINILQSQELAWDGIELSDNVVVLKVRSEIQFLITPNSLLFKQNPVSDK